jgi:N-acetylglucosaminyl-diphospho-decaprenol L-rhamnosyltransferase
MEAVSVDVLVLNFNGAALLRECLPSIVQAAAASRHACRVVVVDNGSTDASQELVAREFPTVAWRSLPNRGLSSFNDVLCDSTCRAALLLNNDVRAERDAFDPLLDTLVEHAGDDEPTCFTAPRCFRFDGRTHEGLQTAVAWRWGLVSASALHDGGEAAAGRPGFTASAGAVLAVDRARFVELGGFDPLYLPGRLEDLDFAYRGFAAGMCGRYVPASVFYHRGAATFDAVLGRRTGDHLALRNTLLFRWKNLRTPRVRLTTCAGQACRIVRDVLKAPFVSADDRFPFVRGYLAARRVWREQGPGMVPRYDRAREREFFARHAPAQLFGTAAAIESRRAEWLERERRRDVDFPISRWCWRPWGRKLAERLAPTNVRPAHVTALGLFAALAAAVCLVAWPQGHLVAAALVAAAWCCDRTDGPLARLQQTVTPLGAWIDANVDECVDLGLHVAAAVAAMRLSDTPWPGIWLVGFLFGKYLLMYGLALSDAAARADGANTIVAVDERPQGLRWWYHLPGNADVRAHLLIAAAATGLFTWELAVVAVYYNLRWPLRYVLPVLRAARGTASGVQA